MPTAANLGIRAGASLDVGGFPSVPHGEDHALCQLLREKGHLVAAPTDVRVRASSRLRGRASGGLADLLEPLSPKLAPAAGTSAATP